MANLVSECLILLKIYEKVLLKMLQVLLAYFSKVLINVGERICNVLLSPGPGVQEHIEDCLLFN